jgi:hypothetical protein
MDCTGIKIICKKCMLEFKILDFSGEYPDKALPIYCPICKQFILKLEEGG